MVESWPKSEGQRKEVSNEKSLIETLNRFGPDLVIVDLEMPVTGVQNVAHLLNRYDPELKFIVLSTHEGREVMEKCKSSGASGYILKRSSAENLIKAVEAAQKGGTFFLLETIKHKGGHHYET